MKSKLKSIASENLGQRAYLELREALADGKFHAGERLRLRELADALGISVTPVREAVLQLVNDGALHLRGLRDIRVRELTADEYREIVQIRVLLECRAIEEFTSRATGKDIAELERLDSKHQAALADRDYGAAASLDRRLMFSIFDKAGMPMLLEMIDRLWLVARPTVTLLYSDEGVAEADLQNNELIEALKRSDPEAAVAARTAIITNCADVIVGFLELENTADEAIL